MRNFPWLAFLAVLSLAIPQVRGDEVDDLFTQIQKDIDDEVAASKAAWQEKLDARQKQWKEAIGSSLKSSLEGAGKTEGTPDEAAQKIIAKVQSDLEVRLMALSNNYTNSEGEVPDFYQRAEGNQSVRRAHSLYQTGKIEEARQVLDQASGSTARPESQEALSKILAALDQAIQKRQAERVATTKALIEEQSAALQKAVKAAEVDPILTALNEGAASLRSNRYDNGETGNQIEGAVTVAQRWQEYLMFVGSNDGAALEALGQILNNSRGGAAGMLPRSLVLERKAKLMGSEKRNSGNDGNALVDKMVAETTTLEQVPALKDKVAELGYGTNLRDEIMALNSGYAALQAKQYDRALGGAVEAFKQPALENLSAQIIIACLPSYLETAASAHPGPAGETLSATLDRLITESAKADRWSAVYRGLNLKRSLRRNNEPRDNSLDDDILAVGSLISGYNFARAGEWVRAVRSFQSSLDKARNLDVVAFIKPQLETIRQDHAADYDKATQPMAVNRGDYPPGTNPQSRQRTAPDGQEGGPTKLPPGPLKDEATPAQP